MNCSERDDEVTLKAISFDDQIAQVVDGSGVLVGWLVGLLVGGSGNASVLLIADETMQCYRVVDEAIQCQLKEELRIKS